MADRAHYTTYLLDAEGSPIPGATVAVREPDTTTLVSVTVYAENDPDTTELGNTFTANADGEVTLWLENPKIVDLYITKTGYDPRTVRAAVTQLVPSTLVLKDDGSSMTQRAGVNFTDGFTLTDDGVADETEVAIDFGESGDITTASFGDSAATGSGVEVARATHAHGMPANPVTAHESTYDHTDIAANVTAIADHIADATDAHDASAISVLDTAAQLTATNVEAALAEILDAEQAHEADASGAHAASAISADSSTLVGTGTDVQAVLEELDNGIADHLADASAAHAATAVSASSATLRGTGTTVQAVLEELDDDIATLEEVLGHCLVNRDLDQNIADTTDVAITFGVGTEEDDTHAIHDTGTNNSRLTVPAALDGKKVRLRGAVRWSSDDTGNRYLYIQMNGTSVVGAARQISFANVFDQQVTTPLFEVSTGDYFEMFVRHNGGSGISVAGDSTQFLTWFELTEEK